MQHLGVIFDSTFDKHMNAVVKSSFFELWLLAKVKPFLCFRDSEKVIRAFSTGLLQQSLFRCQSVTDWATAAALLLCCYLAHTYHLYWFPYIGCQSVFFNNFKIWLFVSKCLHWLMPVCFANLLTLRSSEQMHVAVLRSRLKYTGGWVFQQMSLNCGTNCLCVSRLLQH